MKTSIAIAIILSALIYVSISLPVNQELKTHVVKTWVEENCTSDSTKHLKGYNLVTEYQKVFYRRFSKIDVVYSMNLLGKVVKQDTTDSYDDYSTFDSTTTKNETLVLLVIISDVNGDLGMENLKTDLNTFKTAYRTIFEQSAVISLLQMYGKTTNTEVKTASIMKKDGKIYRANYFFNFTYNGNSWEAKYGIVQLPKTWSTKKGKGALYNMTDNFLPLLRDVENTKYRQF